VVIDPHDSSKTHHEYVYEVESQSQEEIILMAAKSCPTNAIVVIDEESGKQIYP